MIWPAWPIPFLRLVSLRASRLCDFGYLRQAHKKSDGTLGWRCPSEPVKDYVRKGGDEADTRGRKCVCNGLLANIGLGQLKPGGDLEKALITSGDDVEHVARFLKPGARSYRATDVIEYLLRDLGEALCGAPAAYAAT